MAFRTHIDAWRAWVASACMCTAAQCRVLTHGCGIKGQAHAGEDSQGCMAGAQQPRAGGATLLPRLASCRTWTPWRSTSSASEKASCSGMLAAATSSSLQAPAHNPRRTRL